MAIKMTVTAPLYMAIIEKLGVILLLMIAIATLVSLLASRKSRPRLP